MVRLGNSLCQTDWIGKMNNKINLEDKIVDGQHISPVLPEHVKNYMIDIDGTICDDIHNEEPERRATAEG